MYDDMYVCMYVHDLVCYITLLVEILARMILTLVKWYIQRVLAN